MQFVSVCLSPVTRPPTDCLDVCYNLLYIKYILRSAEDHFLAAGNTLKFTISMYCIINCIIVLLFISKNSKNQLNNKLFLSVS